MTEHRRVEHVHALDGLRGVAAVSVFFFHALLYVQLSRPGRTWLQLSPAGLLANGPGAVHVFFVLSGYVLAMSLVPRLSMRETAPFWARRVFRIHPPYLAAVLFAWAAAHVYVMPLWLERVGGVPGTRVRLDAAGLLLAALFPGTAGGQLPVGWSLTVEMAWSLAMPLLLAVALRVHWSVLLAGSVPFLFIGPDALLFARYGIDFALGAVLYLERERLERFLRTLRPWKLVPLLLLAFALLQIPFLVDRENVARVSSIVPLAIGAAIVVACALHRPRIRWLFERPICLFFGRISYSLYLVHLPWLHFVWTLVRDPLIPLATSPIFLVGAFVPAVLTSMASHRYVEMPAMRLGRRIAAALRGRA